MQEAFRRPTNPLHRFHFGPVRRQSDVFRGSVCLQIRAPSLVYRLEDVVFRCTFASRRGVIFDPRPVDSPFRPMTPIPFRSPHRPHIPMPSLSSSYPFRPPPSALRRSWRPFRSDPLRADKVRLPGRARQPPGPTRLYFSLPR